MRLITTTVYLFNELTEVSKKEARRSYRRMYRTQRTETQLNEYFIETNQEFYRNGKIYIAEAGENYEENSTNRQSM